MRLLLIREAEIDDVDDILLLLAELWPDKSLKESDIRSVLIKLIKSPNAKTFLVELNGQVVAFLDLTFRYTLFHQGLTVIIEDLIVTKKFRRKGIGGRLVGYIENIAKEMGCKAIELYSDLYRKEAHRFWRKMGYECAAFQFRKILK